MKTKRTPEQRKNLHARINKSLNYGGVFNIETGIADLYNIFKEGEWKKDTVTAVDDNGETIIVRPEGDFTLWMTFGPCPPFVNIPMVKGKGTGISVESMEVMAKQIFGEESEIMRMFNVPAKKDGRKKKATAAQIAASEGVMELRPRGLSSRNGTTNSTRTMRTRLHEEEPEFYKQFQNGEFKTITETAIAAGLRKPTHRALDEFRRAFNRMTTDEIKTAKAWIKRSAKNDNKINPEWK